MPDEDPPGMDANETGADASPRQRKHRPEIQIYRPGMMRLGSDITSGSSSKDTTRKREIRPGKLIMRSEQNGQIDESYRASSGSTTPDAASFNERGFGSGQKGPNYHPPRHQQQKHDDRRHNNDRYGGRHGQNSPRKEHRDDASDAGSEGRPPSTYNSTQSLYDTRAPGAYLNFRQNDKLGGSARNYGQKFNRQDHHPERASMRAESASQKRSGGGRRRNDSINSTQSERPAQSELHVDTNHETRSQLGEAPSSSGLSYQEICESFESLGSFDWSKEVEMESIQHLQEEEKRQKELEERLAACSTGDEVRSELENERPVRGILRLTVEDVKQGKRNQRNITAAAAGRRGRNEERGGIESDRCSSVSDSIVEEDLETTLEDEEDELRSGERTPTPTGNRNDVRSNWRTQQSQQQSSQRQGNQRRSHEYQGYGKQRREQEKGRDNREHREGYFNNQYGDEQKSSSRNRNKDNRDRGDRGGGRQRDQQEPASRFIGEHDTARIEPPPGSRLAGRITIAKKTDEKLGQVHEDSQNFRGQENQPYQRTSKSPPASTSVSKTREKMPVSSTPKQMSDFPIFEEISANQGPKMNKINEDIGALLISVAKKRNLDDAKTIVELSVHLSALYLEFIARDIQFTFQMNIESHAWKQAFYKPIEAFRSACNSASDQAKLCRIHFHRLLSQGIEFYQKIIALYSTSFDLDLSRLLLWPSGSPPADMQEIYKGQHPLAELSDAQKKLAVKSLARHLICLGSLHRYKTLLDGSEDYSTARIWYLKAAQLWPSNGHAYNQLSVVAFFSMLYRSRRRAHHIPLAILSNQRQNRVLDEIFFCVRALAAGHPYEITRETLHARLESMWNKIRQYEPKIDSECGRMGGGDAAELLDKIPANEGKSEVWLALEGDEWEEKKDSDAAREAYEIFQGQEGSKLYRRTVAYVVHTFGMLITKIGMEHFASVSDRALAQLSALIRHDSSPLTALQLVQIVTLFIYAVHIIELKGAAPDTCSAQQQLAVRTAVALFGVLLEPLAERHMEIRKWIQEGEQVPSEIALTLPALVVLCEWFSCPAVSQIYATMPSVESLQMSIHPLDSWLLLAHVTNELVIMDEEKKLADLREDGSTPCVVPELNYVASFFKVFQPMPRPTAVCDEILNPLSIRLRHVLLAAEYIDGSNLRCFYFDSESKKFCRSERAESPGAIEPKRRHTTKSTDTVVGESNEEKSSLCVTLTREELLERERSKNRTLIFVRPSSLVFDTNAFVDHLELIKKIVDDGRFQVLVPTIVIEELLGLSQGKYLKSEDAQGEYVRAEAKKAMDWLKEKARTKCSKMNTLTTAGRRIAIQIASELVDDEEDRNKRKVNDDRILDSCEEYVRQLPQLPFTVPPALMKDEETTTKVYRQLVLLSEDRGLSIKATAHQIPCRTIISFAKWAKIK